MVNLTSLLFGDRTIALTIAGVCQIETGAVDGTYRTIARGITPGEPYERWTSDAATYRDALAEHVRLIARFLAGVLDDEADRGGSDPPRDRAAACSDNTSYRKLHPPAEPAKDETRPRQMSQEECCEMKSWNALTIGAAIALSAAIVAIARRPPTPPPSAPFDVSSGPKTAGM